MDGTTRALVTGYLAGTLVRASQYQDLRITAVTLERAGIGGIDDSYTGQITLTLRDCPFATTVTLEVTELTL